MNTTSPPASTRPTPGPARLTTALIALLALMLVGGTAVANAKRHHQRRSANAAQRTGGAAFDRSSAAPPGGLLGPRPLRRGSHGRYVHRLQKILNVAGYHVRIDNSFGRHTARVVRTFQHAHGLPVDDVINADDAVILWKVYRAHPKLRVRPPQLPAVEHARVLRNGLAVAPRKAPEAVKEIIAAGNRIAKKPYIYGGGHGHWRDRGYDCSGSVSFALHGADLLRVSRDSTGFESFGLPGAGKWVTLYANAGHVFMIVAGIRFDTSGQSQDGSRWHTSRRPVRGYVVRHLDL